MEMLPDDVWLMVLEKLEEPVDILACRLVCKRLAALAVHPALWRHLKVGHSEPDQPHCSCPVLRLAPCLDLIAAHLPAEGCTQWTFASTRCAAARLHIPIEGTSHAGLAAAIISKQEVLGRLTDVEIDMISVAATDVSILLGTLASTSRLARICVYVYLGGNQLPNTPAPILDGIAVSPSLREFECNLSPLTEPFVKSILSQHAATLEDVLFDFPLSSLTCTSTAPILAGLTNLRMLVCNCLPGMEALAACKSLKILTLTVNTKSRYRPAVAGVAKFLRAAEQLREVSLEYKPAVRSPTDVGAELVLALAWSGRSRVETLDILNRSYTSGSVENGPLLQQVASALPSLSALRHLDLQDNSKRPDALLLAIRPAVAPALQRVEVRLPEGCAHSWLHGDTVKIVMSTNPALHLKLAPQRLVCKGEERCQACELGCHAELRVGSTERLCLFSHDPMDECSEDHSGVWFELWIHLPL